MSYYQQQPQQQQGYGAQNLQFYPSSYGAPGQNAPQQGGYGPYSTDGAASSNYGSYGGNMNMGNFMSSGPSVNVSGRMGEQGGLRSGWLAAFGTEGYDGEPSLLEELGVNFGHIKVKTLTVLNPFGSIDQHIMDDSDLFGPIIFCLLFGTFLLLAGKVHFGYIYGLAAIGSVSLHTIFSLMSNPELEGSEEQSMNSMHGYGNQGHGGNGPDVSTLTYFRSCSVLGYCLLPLVCVSLLGIALPLDTALGYVLTTVAVLWCTYSSSGIFCAVGKMRSMRPLVMYPLMLFYVGFGIMSLFSSRGSGQLAAKVGVS